MAKFTKTYTIELGDRVEFRISKDSQLQHGTVQDISNFPEIWVETGDPKTNCPEYKRYKISVNLIENDIDNYDWRIEDVSFKLKEPLEFVYNDICERTIIRRA